MNGKSAEIVNGRGRPRRRLNWRFDVDAGHCE